MFNDEVRGKAKNWQNKENGNHGKIWKRIKIYGIMMINLGK